MTAKFGDPGAPWNEAVAVVKSDTTVLIETRGLWIGGAGDVTVTMAGPGAEDCTFVGVLAGSILPVAVTKVKAATTATNIVAGR